MGFQFNHVGGGTKTRRPITLHMKYNSGCVQPTCYLMLEDVGEQEVSLEELQVRCKQTLITECALSTQCVQHPGLIHKRPTEAQCCIRSWHET